MRMQSVPTYDILYHLFSISAAPHKSHSIFHQTSISITNVVQQNPRHKPEFICFGDYCFN